MPKSLSDFDGLVFALRHRADSLRNEINEIKEGLGDGRMEGVFGFRINSSRGAKRGLSYVNSLTFSVRLRLRCARNSPIDFRT